MCLKAVRTALDALAVLLGMTQLAQTPLAYADFTIRTLCDLLPWNVIAFW